MELQRGLCLAIQFLRVIFFGLTWPLEIQFLTGDFERVNMT